MDLKNFSDEKLEGALKEMVAKERAITLEIIQLLEEVNRRRLFLQRGYGSLLEYCIKGLGYSEASAYRRISALRMIAEIPEVEEALGDGRLKLATVAQAYSYFKREAAVNGPLTLEQKKEVILSLDSKTTRECEKILLEKLPDAAPTDYVRRLSAQHTQITFLASEELKAKLEHVRNLFSHKNHDPSYPILIDMMADFIIAKLDRSKKKVSHKGVSNSSSALRYIPATTKQQVWRNAQGQCCFVDHMTGRRCSSQFQLQIEHRLPFAKGGSNELQNLELLCAAHNRLRAAEQFGEKAMKAYLK